MYPKEKGSSMWTGLIDQDRVQGEGHVNTLNLSHNIKLFKHNKFLFMGPS